MPGPHHRPITESLGVGPSSGIFLLLPRCLSCAAKVESLWPEEHPSTSMELKKPTQQSLTLLSNTSLGSHGPSTQD